MFFIDGNSGLWRWTITENFDNEGYFSFRLNHDQVRFFEEDQEFFYMPGKKLTDVNKYVRENLNDVIERCRERNKTRQIDLTNSIRTHYPCDNGLKRLRNLYPDDLLPLGSSILDEYKKAEENGVPDPQRTWCIGRFIMPSEIGIVAGADLSYISLHYAILDRLDLSGIKANKTNFIHTSMCSTNLSKSSLVDALFCSSNLQNSDFSECDLTNANFRSCNLVGVKFHGATLSNANFFKALRSRTDDPIEGWVLNRNNELISTEWSDHE